jgi:hypothetical protein
VECIECVMRTAYVHTDASSLHPVREPHSV